MIRKVALSMLLIASACGGGAGGGGGGGPGNGTTTGPATVSEYCDQYWTELAGRWAECNRGSAAYYAAIYAPSLRCWDKVQAVTAGRATYNPGHAGACLEHVATASCYALEDLLADKSPQPDCLAAVAGKSAAGSECYSNESCASDLCGTSSCPSICVTPLPQGGYCGGGERCARGLMCEWWSSGTCQPRKAQDATCFFDADCQPGLICTGSLETTCQPRRGTGGSCSSDRACAIGYQCGPGKMCFLRGAPGDGCTQGTNVCGPGLWCGPGATGTCIDGPVVNQSCATTNGEIVPCIGSWCEYSTGSVCRAWLGENDACTSVPQTQCMPTIYCDGMDNVCKTFCGEP